MPAFVSPALDKGARALLLTIAIAATAGCHHSRPTAPVGIGDAEVVNIGYGTRATRDVTGAVGSVTTEEFAAVRASRVEEMLEGRFAGLDVVRRPSGEFSLRIRGARGEPLIVVDGVPSPHTLSNPLRDLAPGSIARIDVLKDAGSTAAYGARGAHGVILITTKRAR